MLDFLLNEPCWRTFVKQGYKRILVVDDEENARVALSKILTHDGYDV
jgi:PleD family two-component response regulator